MKHYSKDWQNLSIQIQRRMNITQKMQK